ncbi:lipid IV(A) 3-deoxy-D-manno-octulosonic acid transferase [Aliidiomarina taiwanensis]|nr:lipid IV(A) 3-deoxy-D-manno-octulosonic acid transferase [Aliidiomarina taiwanensis]
MLVISVLEYVMRAGCVRLLYTLLFYLMVPLLLLSLFWQSRKNPAYRRRWGERFGFVQVAEENKPTLVHCASVGEFLAAKGFIEQLLDNGTPVWVTCTTPTGSELIQHFLQGRGEHSYLPLDLPCAVGRFLQRVKPQTIVLMETELWPNLVHAGKKHGIPQALINARMSQSSMKGYLRAAWLFRPSWQTLQLCGVQNGVQAERFLQLGVRTEALQVTGNLKFDVKIPPQVQRDVSAFKTLLSDRPIITAGSTHAGEEEIVLAAFRQLLSKKPDALLILVPRHKERFEEVAHLIQQSGLRMVRRSSGDPMTADTQVLLADSMGELMVWYGVASVAFVGGSLIERGGHNPLEPMAYGLPILSGPHVFNFTEVYQQLDAHKAIRWVHGEPSMEEALFELLTCLDQARHIGDQAQQVFARHRGATVRTYAAVQSLQHEPTL